MLNVHNQFQKSGWTMSLCLVDSLATGGIRFNTEKDMDIVVDLKLCKKPKN